jgi:hypothetical protein
MTPRASSTACVPAFIRALDGMVPVSARNTGTMPGGSTMTNRVT